MYKVSMNTDRHNEINYMLEPSLRAAWFGMRQGMKEVSMNGNGDWIFRQNVRSRIDGMLDGILACSSADYELVKDDLMMLWEMTLMID